MKTMLVRIKPRDPHHGRVMRRFGYKGIRFEEGRGWYRVSAEVAEHLRTVRQKAHDPSSQLAFDVCTEDEALTIDTKEAEEAEPKRPADSARPATARGEAPVAKPPVKARRGRKPGRKPRKKRGAADTEPASKGSGKAEPDTTGDAGDGEPPADDQG